MRASYSSLNEFRRCARQFAYGRIAHLEADRPMGTPLLVGIWMHALLAADSIERGRKHGSLLIDNDSLSILDGMPDLPMDGDNLVARVLECAGDWWTNLDGEERDVLTETVGKELPEHLRNIFIRYTLRWQEHTDQERPLVVEQWVERDVPGTDLTLIGRVDEVLIDGRNIVIVRDHKTMQSWPNEPTIVTEIMDSQLHLYPWMVSPLLGDHKPQAIERNMLRVKPPSVPTLTKGGNLSKAITDYDLPTYEAWLRTEPTFEGTKKDGSGAGTYARDEAHAEKLAADVDKFFQRRLRPINMTVIREHIAAAARDAARAEQLTDVASAPRSTGKHCSWCPALRLCHAELYGSLTDEQYDPAAYGLRVKERKRS